MRRERTARWWIAVAAAGLLGAVGCKSTGTPVAEEPLDDMGDAPAMVETEPADTGPRLDPVYFDYDRWQLREDARKTLQSNAEQIKENPDWGVLTIAGHCDERGSDEYNLALGERRAAAVKRYLQDLGIPAQRFETVSFGEDRPAVPGHDESAWRYNRRTELQPETLQLSRW